MISQDNLDELRAVLARCGAGDAETVDLFIALDAGLTGQQLSNDPSGDRWIRLIDAAETFS